MIYTDRCDRSLGTPSSPDGDQEEPRLARVVRSNRQATVASQFVAFGAAWPQTGQGAHADPCPLPKAPTMGT